MCVAAIRRPRERSSRRAPHRRRATTYLESWRGRGMPFPGWTYSLKNIRMMRLDPSDAIKDLLYEQVATISKAVASPKRLELIELLCQSEKTVETLAEQAQISVKLASAHLRQLKSARLVASRRDGKYVYYRLVDHTVADFWVGLRQLAEERLLELQQGLEPARRRAARSRAARSPRHPGEGAARRDRHSRRAARGGVPGFASALRTLRCRSPSCADGSRICPGPSRWSPTAAARSA